jgi:hypothetical protein
LSPRSDEAPPSFANRQRFVTMLCWRRGAEPLEPIQTAANLEMISMQKISIAFLAAVSLASFGCPKKSSSGDAIVRQTEFRDRMCACKDRACAEKVTEDLTRWGQEQAKASGDKIIKMSDDDMKKSAAVSGEMSACMTKILAEGGGATGGGAAAGGGSAAAGSADGSAAATGGAGGAAGSAGGSAGAGGSAAPAGAADGSAAAGSAH